MKDKKLLFDRSCHVLYSRPCKKEIRAKIALHYPEAERETIWEQVQRQYADFLSDWRTDLGGKRNFHNGVGGTYDCIAIMSYYTVCKAVTSFREIEEMEENLILPIFRRLRFVDCNKPFWRKLMYRAFVRAKRGCDKWHDYEMVVAPYENDKPIYYEFTSCPAAEFAIRHGLTDIMPALCNVDYASMELLHARLVRTTTCVDGCRCDYTICGDKDPYLKGASRIPGRGGLSKKQIILQRKGGETNGNLSWNHDPFLGYNTGLGLRVLHEKIPWRSGAARPCRLCRRGDGGGVNLEPADPRHRAVGGHGQAVLSPRLYRLLGRRAVFASARPSDSPPSCGKRIRRRGRKAGSGRTTMMVLAVTLHNIPEGMAVGVMYAGFLAGNAQITAASALVLSLGIAIQNFPEGAIISMPLRAEGESKGRGVSRRRAFRRG